MSAREQFLREVVLQRERVTDFGKYPFSIPAVRKLETLRFHPRVTFFVGENGSGKSTLVEAIAVAAGFNAEGGTTNFNFATRRSESDLHKAMTMVRGVKRPRTGFFLRAESFFNVATNIEELDRAGGGGGRIIDSYGGESLHEKSHGESFLALLKHRFGREGLYILDEPEAALSPQRQLALLQIMHRLVVEKSQFIIATHSPIVLAYPDATIYSLDGDQGLHEVKYEDTEHFSLTRDFLQDRARYLRRLLE